MNSNQNNQDVNMNIPSKQQPQPEPVPQQPTTPQSVQERTTQIHDPHQTKMTFLLVITVVLGIISVVSLIFALKMKGGSFTLIGGRQTEEIQPEQSTVVEETTPSQTKSEGFDPKKEVEELDKLNLEEIEESYLNTTLQEQL